MEDVVVKSVAEKMAMNVLKNWQRLTCFTLHLKTVSVKTMQPRNFTDLSSILVSSHFPLFFPH